MKTSIAFLCLLLLTGLLHAGTNPFEQVAEDSYSGRFVGPDVTFRLKPEAGKWTGTILFKGQNYTIQGENQDGKLAGTFGAGDQSWAFTATSDGDNLTFTAGTFTAKLTRQKLPKMAGVYASKRVKLDFQNQDGGLNGTITFNGKQFQFTATETVGDLAGVFKNGEEAFQFTLVNDPAGLTFQTEKFSECVQRMAVTNSLGMKFVPVPGTQVLFCIWDVRVQDFETFVNATGYEVKCEMSSQSKYYNGNNGETWRNPGFTQGATHPVVAVSWNDAKTFCEWLSKKEGKTYRLPTDSEWSTAVGLANEFGSTPKEKDGKIKGIYPWGTTWPPPDDVGNYADHAYLKANNMPRIAPLFKDDEDMANGIDFNDGYVNTSPVGSFAPNRFGLFDMGGNVSQLCEDWYDGDQKYRVTRGMDWGFSVAFRTRLMSSDRGWIRPSSGTDKTGFRCVLE